MAKLLELKLEAKETIYLFVMKSSNILQFGNNLNKQDQVLPLKEVLPQQGTFIWNICPVKQLSIVIYIKTYTFNHHLLVMLLLSHV